MHYQYSSSIRRPNQPSKATENAFRECLHAELSTVCLDVSVPMIWIVGRGRENHYLVTVTCQLWDARHVRPFASGW